ncbi:unnamed protein product [Coregonus sp. 'balchen']|nr:unnamed protein product [Coregonus sp. 'balchen']
MYRYRLETYTESRSSAWEMEPYTGQVVDGPQYGMSPPPWDVPVQQPQRYTDVILKTCLLTTAVVVSDVSPHYCCGCFRRVTDAMAVVGRAAHTVLGGEIGDVRSAMDMDAGQQDMDVYPIVGFPDQEICDASKKASQEHHSKFSPQQVPCRILQQSHPAAGDPSLGLFTILNLTKPSRTKPLLS